MKITKTILMLGVGCFFTLAACNNPDANKTEGEPTALPPTNGDETRYNLNQSDTIATPIDTNQVDSSSNR
ncbi:hypothetical protein [Sphingobacterium hungaricum]